MVGFKEGGEIFFRFLILHEVMFAYFWREIFKGSYFEFFHENVVMGNAVQIFSNFPAKRLSIYIMTPL